MDETTLIIAAVALLVGLVLGALVAHLLTKSAHQSALANARLDATTARAELAEARERAARDELSFAEHQMQLSEAHRINAEANTRIAEISAQAASAFAQRDAATERAKDALADREAMLNQFHVLSTQTLETHAKAAEKTAQERLAATEQMMQPLVKSLAAMEKNIHDVEKSREQSAAQLSEQVRQISASNESLRKETFSLSQALRAPQIRGAWGEQSLRRIVELSGLIERCDFFEQASTRTSDGLFRPDLTIRLAGDKVVFVDAKTPLSALLDAYNTEDEDLRNSHLTRFGKHVRKHIDDLAKKQYWSLDAGSPEFVVLFLSSEETFRAALVQQPDLQEYANTSKIVLASPSTLIALLKTVAHGWQQERLAESVLEIQTLGRDLYERLATMSDHFNRIGAGLTSAVNAYNQTVGSLESRVLVSARRFTNYDISTKQLTSPTTIEPATRSLSSPEFVRAELCSTGEPADTPPDPT